MEWITGAYHYLIIRTEVADTLITTNVLTFKHKKDAMERLIVERDILINHLAEYYEPREITAFDVDVYGSISFSPTCLEYTDYDGELQIKYEIKKIKL